MECTCWVRADRVGDRGRRDGSIGPDVTKSAAAVAAKAASGRSDLLINSGLHVAAGVAVLFFVTGPLPT